MAYPPSRHQRIFSERLYQLLLLAYPRAFREEYSSEMFLVFCDAYRETLHRQGTLGVLCLWKDFFGDFVKTVCIQRVSSWTERNGRDFVVAGKERLTMALQFRLELPSTRILGSREPTMKISLSRWYRKISDSCEIRAHSL